MENKKNILLVQFFSNGDCLYATAVARQIKNDFPGCRLTWAIADFCKNIIAGNPYVDEIMIVDAIEKNNSINVYKHVKRLQAMKGIGFDEIFITQDTMGDTHANFDGYIRSRILISYPHPITVPLQPVLQLSEEEKSNAAAFATSHVLHHFKNVILFEFAPLSGQITLSKEDAVTIAKGLTAKFPDTAVILSSANKLDFISPAVIDGSSLSLRETAALTHYCHFLLGCSSGITWITTSQAAKMLPMVQLIDPDALYLNSPANDFKKFNIPDKGIIELQNFEASHIMQCFTSVFENGFETGKELFNEKTALNFKTTPGIVYHLISSFKWLSLFTHLKVNLRQQGLKPAFLLAFIKGFAFTPYYFIKNKLRKSGISLKK